jgi:hypothetical protein
LDSSIWSSPLLHAPPPWREIGNLVVSSTHPWKDYRTWAILCSSVNHGLFVGLHDCCFYRTSLTVPYHIPLFIRLPILFTY